MDTLETKLRQGIMSVSEIMTLVCTEIAEPIYELEPPTVYIPYKDSTYFYKLKEKGNFHYFELTIQIKNDYSTE